MELPKLPLWYGIPGIEFCYNGDWSEPEVRYKHRLFSAWHVEDMCHEEYKEAGVELSFEDWMKANPSVAYNNLQILIDEDDMTIDAWRFNPSNNDNVKIEDWRFDPDKEPCCAYDYLAHKILESGYEIKTGLSNLMVMMILHFDNYQEEVDFMEAHIDSPEAWAQAVIDEVEASGGFREFDYWC